MFYVLMLIGSGLILLGLNKRRMDNLAPENAFEAAEAAPPADSLAFDEIRDRMEQLEKLVFQSMVNSEEKKAEEMAEPAEEAEVQEAEKAPKQPMPDNVREILEYESQGLSLQEIANITRMNKGEVLLLKNLSKHYSR